MQTGPASASDAIAELHRRHHLRLLRLAVLLSGDRLLGEQIVHHAFAALQDSWSALADQTPAIRYLRVSVVNGVRATQRRQTVVRRYLRAAEPEAVSAADWATLVAHEHREVIAALRNLHPRQREVLVLRYWSELSEDDLALTLGISRSAVKSTTRRGLGALARQLRFVVSGDTERRLRAALAAGAEAIGDPGPQRAGDSNAVDAAATRARQGPPPLGTSTARLGSARVRELMGSQRWALAAAAVILAVLAALGVGLRNADRRHLTPVRPTTATEQVTPPAAPAPSPRPTSLHPGSCVATVPPRC